MGNRFKEFTDNIVNLIKGEEEDIDENDDEYEAMLGYESEEQEEEYQEDRRMFGRKNNNSKVVNMGQPGQVEIIIRKPVSIEQSVEICELLKEKKVVVVNLETVSKDESRRIVDIISGSVLALDAKLEKVSSFILLVAPHSCDVTNEINKENIKRSLDSLNFLSEKRR